MRMRGFIRAIPPMRTNAGHITMLTAITGRMETRRATVCHDIDRLQERHGRPGPAAIGKVEAGRETANTPPPKHASAS